MICSFGFDALNIIYVHLTNFKINLIYPLGKICIKTVCVFHVSFLVGKKKTSVWSSLMKSMFNFDVVLSKMSNSTFAMILIT